MWIEHCKSEEWKCNLLGLHQRWNAEEKNVARIKNCKNVNVTKIWISLQRQWRWLQSVATPRTFAESLASSGQPLAATSVTVHKTTVHWQERIPSKRGSSANDIDLNFEIICRQPTYYSHGGGLRLIKEEWGNLGQNMTGNFKSGVGQCQ